VFEAASRRLIAPRSQDLAHAGAASSIARSVL
jgi:hypothetical protein